VEKRIDPNINKILKKYREIKKLLLENLFQFFLKNIQNHFRSYDDQNTSLWSMRNLINLLGL